MMASVTATCGCCGTQITDTDRIDVRLRVPDAALALPEESRQEVNAGLLRVAGAGSFVRCLLPVRLTGDLELVLGTWLRISDTDLKRLKAVWDEPEYADVVLHGTLANAIKPWADELLDAPATAVVRDVDQIPYVDDRTNPLGRQVWDRDEVLSCFPHALPVNVHTEITEEWSIERTAGLDWSLAERTTRFAGPDRAVFLDVYNDRAGRSPEEFLQVFTENAPDTPPTQSLTEHQDDALRHASWRTATVDGRTQHELYGQVVRAGSLLSILCLHDNIDDHAWALHVLRSATYHAPSSPSEGISRA
jgi:hypothetical protein